MAGLHVTLSDEPQMPPPDADFIVEIDFRRGVGNPRRVFDALSVLIDGFQRLDQAAVIAIRSELEPALVLEDIRSGSIKIWLRNVIRNLDDEALKGLDWKPLIGQYLVKTKYAALKWLDDPSQPSLQRLGHDIQRLAAESDVLHLPDYAPPPEGKLLEAVARMQDGKRLLRGDDRLRIETKDMVYEVDLRTDRALPSVGADKIEVLPAAPTESRVEMVLTVRKPDLIGKSMWQFKHGSMDVSAPIKDTDWLHRFHHRQVPVLSGDALRCLVRLVYAYDKAGRLLDQKLEIERVLGVIPGPGAQGDFDEF